MSCETLQPIDRSFHFKNLIRSTTTSRMSLLTISAAQLRVLGCLLMILHFANVVRAYHVINMDDQAAATVTTVAPAIVEKTTETPTTVVPLPTRCKNESQIYKSNCTGFFMYTNGYLSYIACKSGKTFSKEANDCVEGPNLCFEVTTQPNDATLPPCDDANVITHWDCAGYWLCLNRRRERVDCHSRSSLGTTIKVYNHRKRKCQPAAKVPRCTVGVPGEIHPFKTPIPVLPYHQV